MTSDRNSAPGFSQWYARHRVTEFARHPERFGAGDGDVFSAHARGVAREGVLSTALSLSAVAVLVGVAILLWG